MRASGQLSTPERLWRRFRFSVASLAKMIERAPSVPVISADADGFIDFWNAGAERVFGLPAREVVGKSTLAVLFPPASADELRGAMGSETFRRGEPLHLEVPALTFASKPLWVRLSVSARLNSAGKPVGIVAIGEDITERKSRTTKQAAIYAISAAIQAYQSPEDLFRSIHQSISEILPAKNFYIALYDRENDLLSFPYFVDEFDPPPKPRKPGKGLTEYVLRASVPLLASPERFRKLVECGEVESVGEPSLDWLGVPLRVADQTLGVLVVQTYSEGTRYTEDDRQLLSFVSSQVAMAIDRTQKEQSLRTSENELRGLFSAMSDVVLLLDDEGRYLKIAPTNPALLYKPSDQLIGKTIREVFPPPLADLFMGYVRDALATRAPVKGGYSLQINGEEIWFEATISPAGDNKVLLVARDNTARRRMEEALREAEENYKGIFEHAVMGIAKCTPDGKYVSVNPALARIYGYDTPEELLADTARNGAHLAVDPGRSGELAEQPRTQDKSSGTESQVTRKDGTLVWVSENVQTVRDGAGRVSYYIVTVEDITARKQAEKELRLLANTITCAKDCFILSDLEGRILFVNEALLATYGYNDQELLGKNVAILLPPETSPAILQEMYATSADGWNGELMHRRKDGTDFPVELWSSVVRSDSGEPIAHVGVARDITGRKRSEEKIRKSLDEKEVLLKEIHHRVKNNLQIISSLLNLQTGQVKDRQLLEILRESQNRIRSMALIHERLYRSEDFSSVDFGQYVDGLTTFLVRSYAGASRCFNLRVDVQAVSLGVDVAIPCGLIINELVSNCLKHAFPQDAEGEITVALRREGEQYLLRIEDNGVGLPRDIDLKKVESLGLQLVETLSTQIGGTIDITSVPGRGTAFTIMFPAH